MTSALEDAWKEFLEGERDYWRKVAESEGFDTENLVVPRNGGLSAVNCQHRRFRLRTCLPKIYAMVGLHRYNVLKGTNFQYLDLLKYSKSMNFVRSFFITSVAVDPSTLLQKTFQLRLDEKSCGNLDLTVSIARAKDEEKVITTKKRRFIAHYHGEAAADPFYQGVLPDWPSFVDFNDQRRFYLVNEADLLANDWIHLYLKLAICVRNQTTSESELSNLQILKVAIETKEEDVQPPNARLESKSAIFYITFKGFAGPLIGDDIGEHVERQAIVRRVLDMRSGYMTFRGRCSIGEKALNTEQPVSGEEALDKEQSSEKRPRLH